MKRVLITSGAVYGPLDDNKLVGNRVRGIWATRFASWLAKRGHFVTLLVADTQEDAAYNEMRTGIPGNLPPSDAWQLVTHKGFWDYHEKCVAFASSHDAAAMAAAVVNWIPAKPFAGKMWTTSLREVGLDREYFKFNEDEDIPIPGKSIVNIPFILAPRVIDDMRVKNPKLTLIGCKMTIGATRDEMIEAAYKTLVGAKCHAVVANDMAAGLRAKTVLYPDRAKFEFDVGSEEGQDFYHHLEAVICDEHFTTQPCGPCWVTEQHEYVQARALFDLIVDKYRSRFVHKNGCMADDRVFGAVAVRMPHGGALCSPREKNVLFSSKDAVDVAPIVPEDVKNRAVTTVNGHKASMNAFLLVRHLEQYPSASAVLHLHEQLPDVPTVPYAPPGTVRDNLREIVGQAYNITGHGCVISLDQRGEMYGKWEY